jgi:hypothetical protein
LPGSWTVSAPYVAKPDVAKRQAVAGLRPRRPATSDQGLETPSCRTRSRSILACRRGNRPCTNGHGANALTLIEVIVPDYRQRRHSHDARPVEVPIEADVLGEGMKFVLGIGCEAEPRWFVGPVAALTK